MGYQPTTAQERIIEFADQLFDLSWKQATTSRAINFHVPDDDFEDLKKYMSVHGYEDVRLYNESTARGEIDVSFGKN